MINANTRAERLVTAELLPILEQAAAEGRLSELHVPTDEELGEDAARAWADCEARGIVPIEPRTLFFQGYAACVRNLYGLFGLYEEDLHVIGPILLSPELDETQWTAL